MKTIAQSFRDEGIQQGIQQGMQQGMQAGIYQGMQQGMQAGIHKEQRQIARNMLSKGTDIRFISDVTRLSIDEINSLR